MESVGLRKEAMIDEIRCLKGKSKGRHFSDYRSWDKTVQKETTEIECAIYVGPTFLPYGHYSSTRSCATLVKHAV